MIVIPMPVSHEPPHAVVQMETMQEVAAQDPKAQAFISMLGMLCDYLPETAKHVETSTCDLSNQFHMLADTIKQQSGQMQDVIEMATYIASEGKQISISDFMSEFSSLLSGTVGKILQISKLAVTMVYNMNQAMENLGAVESFIAQVQKINKQTNLLALNANIEASRAGEAGRGFDVVAKEVKQVSAEISQMSNEMRQKIAMVSESVRRSFDTLQEVATTDMTNNILAKEKLDQLMQVMLDQNEKFRGALSITAATSSEVASSITHMIMGMQFQDRNTQNIQNSVIALEQAMKYLQEKDKPRAVLSAAEKDALIEKLLSSFTLSEFRHHLLARLMADGVIGEDHPLALNASSKPSSSSDIELF